MYKILVTLLIVSYSAAGVSSEGKIGNHDRKDKILPRNATRLSKEVYRKIYKIMRFSRAYRNHTFESAVDFINEMDSWTPPTPLANRFPYYHAGYDDEDRPIWYAEVGKYKVDDLIERTIELFPVAHKLMFQFAIKVAKSLVARDEPGKEIRQFVLVLDHEGVDVKLVYKLIAHPEIIEFGISIMDSYLDIAAYTVGQLILINANYATKLMIDLARPLVGELMERVVALGGNKYRWKAELRRILPEDTIPPWYGGPKDFKPIAVYG